MAIKNKRFIFFTFFILLYFFIEAGFCSAAWKFNAGTYPKLPPWNYTLTPSSRLPAYILYIFGAGIYIGGALAVLSLAIAGIQFMMSAEDPSKVSTARDRIKGSIIGLIILLGTSVILGTINPQLQQLGTTISFVSPSGLHFDGPGGDAGAPTFVSDMSNYEGKYTSLKWPATVPGADRGNIYNCDKNIADYMVYVYKGANFSNAVSSGKITCGGGSIDISQGDSYIAQAEMPGVYFCKNAKCAATIGSNETPVQPTTTNIPSIAISRWHDNVYYVKIINGPDKNGPFFSTILFGQNDYKGAGIWQWDTGNQYGDRDCHKIETMIEGTMLNNFVLTEAGSALIYQNAIQGDNAGVGVTLYNQRDQANGNGGLYCPNNNDENHIIVGNNNDINFTNCKIPGAYFANTQMSMLDIDLSKAKIQWFIGGSAVTPGEEAACTYFAGQKNKSKDCFQSLKIEGRFLVLLSHIGGSTTEGKTVSEQCGSSSNVCFEAFPRPPGAPDNSTDLNHSEIGNVQGNILFVRIIPLAQPLFPGSAQ